MKIKRLLRNLIRRSPLLYPCYLKLFGLKLDRRFPVQGVDLHVTGYPRCANTFAMRLLRHAFPELLLSTHIHAIASLKMALRNRIPTVVLVREPVQAVASLVLKGALPKDDSESITSYLADYVDYYGYVVKHGGSFKCLDFRELTGNPYSLIEAVSPYVDTRIEEGEFKKCLSAVLSEMKNAEVTRADSVSQLPNQEKEHLKQSYCEAVQQHPLFDEAMKIYQSLGV